ncbi:hypothetical protein SNOG_05031 [Parastagonospora nodorum SN15]|uniref:Uncharacterized protein n=1 Tax=Phaeosphaeria nodorum (strain SN15 / ATCC MYA-4574 / FGSC 10173) TaxID=321614 RepID=Q0UT83_PHANO|nr:hypothetical protein SNOG_05031 [Parastagonospora nodorum SN15]EAT87422.1 hypothetical protein SNOG_05031 [Parastagonospora nodorum SN15]
MPAAVISAVSNLITSPFPGVHLSVVNRHGTCWTIIWARRKEDPSGLPYLMLVHAEILRYQLLETQDLDLKAGIGARFASLHPWFIVMHRSPV